jgi:hypothetical protein
MLLPLILLLNIVLTWFLQRFSEETSAADEVLIFQRFTAEFLYIT